MSNTVSTFMSNDHDRLDALFAKFSQAQGEDAKELFHQFRSGLQKHIVWEEKILFPAFEQKTGVQQGPTEIMRQEHLQIKELLNMIQQDVKNKNAAQQLHELLSQHNVKEEQVLYPAIDQVTSAQEQQELLQKIKELPKEAYCTCCQ